MAPGEKIDLREHDPARHDGLTREDALAALDRFQLELAELQEELYGAARHSVLVVLQGLDASGKDGVIRRVMNCMSPQGVRVESFKVPTAEELGHDFLWRVHRVVPRKGMVGVFNRSHYEAVLVERVHNLVPKATWKKRYAQINAFEELLRDGDTIVVKFFLHLSKSEQRKRFVEREQDSDKAWKLAVGDWTEREVWNENRRAYQDALSRCSTDAAPWYIVPADRKWFRDLAVCETLVQTLRAYREQWRETLREISRQRLAELAGLTDRV